MYGVPWEEPRVCRGCTRDPCTEDPSQCASEAIERAADEAFDRMRDERDEHRTTGVEV